MSKLELEKYFKGYRDELLEKARKTGKLPGWNAVGFMEYVWSQSPDYGFTQGDMETVSMLGKTEIKKLRDEYLKASLEMER